jgi:LETM1 and EF-hand domain-containing protein 1
VLSFIFIFQFSKCFLKKLIAFNIKKNPHFLSNQFTCTRDGIRHTLQHYWVGTKLLGTDVKIAWRIIRQVLNGKTLTRRERRQLVRTTADVARLVPMLFFLIVPFMEFLLPVALYFFPGMMPSTFTTSLEREEKMKQKLKVKIAMATLLQESVVEAARELHSKNNSEDSAHRTTARELEEFIARVRDGGTVSNEELIKYAGLFEDSLTLDTLSRAQLIALAEILQLSSLGPDGVILYRIRSTLGAIKKDDRVILEEGIASLDHKELAEASQKRGMRSLGMTSAQMRRQIESWIDLSTNKNVPATLLLMSRAFILPTGRVRRAESGFFCFVWFGLVDCVWLVDCF